MTDNEKALLELVLSIQDWGATIPETKLRDLSLAVLEERVSPELLEKVAEAEAAHRDANRAFRARIRELEREYSKDAVEVASMRTRSM